MTIAKRITILYGGIFSISIMIISGIVLMNVAVFNQNIIKHELLKTMDNIEQSLLKGEIITQEKLTELLDNKYVEVILVKEGGVEVIKSSVGSLPPFVNRQYEMPPQENKPPKEDRNKNNSESNDKRKDFIKSGRDYTIRSVNGHEFMLAERKVPYNGISYCIQTFKMIGSDMEYLRLFGLKLIIMDMIGILIAFMIGKYISSQILKPVQNIRKAAERISIEDLSRRIEVTGPVDEMTDLTVTFNSMIERLEGAFIKQNQFVSDASHELRTPISVIQGYANLINRWGKDDPNVLQESIDSIMAETEHMSTLIKKLLFLAKSDQNKNHIQKVTMSLNAVTSEIVKELNIMEINRNVLYEEKDEVEIFADFDLIKQLLWIYTENAIKYTEDNGIIKFTVYKNERYGYVSVEDNGTGMEEESIPLVFDRFFRADKSRNKEIPGTGLGLSIAKWIIDSHNGQVSVESEKGKGTIFISKFNLNE